MPADQRLADEGDHAEPDRHRAVDDDDDHRGADEQPVGRSGRAPCRPSRPGGSAGPRSRRPSRSRRARPAGWPLPSARLAPKTSQTNTGRQASRTRVMRLGTVRIPLVVGAARIVIGRRGDHGPILRSGGSAQAMVPSPECAACAAVPEWEPMPRFSPFRGLRYDPARHPARPRSSRPPYDVIEPADRMRLATRSLVQLGPPRAARGGPAGGASTATRWPPGCSRRGGPTGSSSPRTGPAFYPYRMTDPDGRPDPRGHRRPRAARGRRGGRGPAARGDPAQAPQRPPRPADGDRRQPLPHLGPLADPGLSAALAPDGPPEIDVHDDDGVRHELWVVPDDSSRARSPRPSPPHRS